MTYKPNKKFDDYITTYQSRFIVGTAGAAGNDEQRRFDVCPPSNLVVDDNPLYDSANGAARIPEVQFIEPQYLQDGTAADVKQLYHARVNLQDYHDSIMALDKDIIFNETILIRFVWNDKGKIVFAAGLNPGDTVETSTVPAAGFNVTNIELHLAVEVNAAIRVSLEQQVMGAGLSVLMDYTYNNTLSSTGNRQTTTLRINRANGLYLKRIYHSLVRAAGAINNGGGDYDIANIAEYADLTKTTSFYTNLNNNRIQQQDLICANADDYRYLYYLLKGTVILGHSTYQNNWVWIEDFEDCDSGALCESNFIRGIDLNLGEQKWDFVATTPNENYNHVSFVVCKRRLNIGPNCIVLE